MTPEELRALADEATPGPWNVNRYEHGGGRIWVERDLVADAYQGQADVELFVLAPDLARLCAEYAGAFAQIEKLHHKDFDLAPKIASRALAKLSELKSVT